MRRQYSIRAMICILAAAALFSTAHAHGGGLHKYSYRQDVRQCEAPRLTCRVLS